MSLRFVFSPISATSPTCQLYKSSSVPNSLFQALRPLRRCLASFAVKIFFRLTREKPKNLTAKERQEFPRSSQRKKKAELGHYR